MSRKTVAGAGLALLGLAVVLVLFSFWRENWAANQAPGRVEQWLAGWLLSGSRDVADRPNPLPATAANLAEGREIYEQQCAFCHGLDGRGAGQHGVQFYPPVPSLLPPQNQLSDSQMHYVIQRGIRYTGMPSFANILDSDEIWKVVLWVRRLATPPSPPPPETPATP